MECNQYVEFLMLNLVVRKIPVGFKILKAWQVFKNMYEGNSISKLQIVIEKNRMEIMTYKQHLFFKIISIQI